MEQAVTRKLERFDSCLIIDLHSYPSAVQPYELHKSAARPDVRLGTDPFHTPAWLIERIRGFYKGSGMTVVENEPFGGTFVPALLQEGPPRDVGDDRAQAVAVHEREDGGEEQRV
jgi:N-formylglutamate deformylase